MTDRPGRTSTMVPPPDRERKTDPPMPTEPAPPEGLLGLSENVLPRLDAIETSVRDVNAHLSKLDVLHALLGEMNEHLTIIKENSKSILDGHAKYVNEVSRVHKENGDIRATLNEHDARLMLLESDYPESDPAPETNGNGHDK